MQSSRVQPPRPRARATGRRVRFAALIATLAGIAALIPTQTAAAAPAERPSATVERAAAAAVVDDTIATYIGNEDGSVIAPLSSPDGQRMLAKARAGLAAPLIDAAHAHGRSVLTRAVSVGLGWYIYVYLNAGNINWLRGLGYTAATGALCALLVSTVAGSIACGVAAYIVWTIFYRPTTIPSGYCMEYKFTYAGSFAGSKLVRRSC